MSDDVFAAPVTTPAASHPAWGSVPALQVAAAPAAAVTISASTLIGAGAAVAAALACLGAWAPWFSISLFGVSANFSGLHSQLDGRYVMVLGLVGVVLAVALVVLPRGTPSRSGVLGGLALIGVVGFVIVARQYVHLSDTASMFSGTFGVPGVSQELSIHAGPGWGLWLDGFAFAGLVTASVLGVVL
jgi:hypothetical protein